MNELSFIGRELLTVPLVIALSKLEDKAFFASWFVEGWKALDSECVKAKAGSHRIAADNAGILLDFVPGAGENLERLGRVEEDLTTIFRQAQDLNTTLSSSKAVFKRRYPSYGEPYDASCMEVAGYGEAATPSSTVLFSVSPQITKHGNADGQHYDSQMVLVKATVVVRDKVEDLGSGYMEF